MSDYTRLLNPESIALIGGGWAANVVEQLKKSGYQGEIWPVHPSRREVCGLEVYRSLEQLPAAPDVAFVGVNRELSVELVDKLSTYGAGGVVCFASGFKESQSGNGGELQSALLSAAGSMPLLGPNCYGFLNYLDNVCLWPDQHGGQRVETGVAIFAQSSNVAINMTMQKRGLPIGQLFTLGNQAQIEVSNLASHVVKDARITALGLYLESFGDVRAFESMVHQAHALGKPIVVLKIGRSKKGRMATRTHTAALTGSAAVSSAFLRRLGVVEVSSVEAFLDALKLVDKYGYLQGNRLASISCSGGEASLMADAAESTFIDYPEFSTNTIGDLRVLLGPNVDVANPLDYHTYIWGDTAIMAECFASVLSEGLDLTACVLDIPRADRCDPVGHQCAVDAIIDASQRSASPICVIATLPENLEESVVEQFANAGIPTLHGMQSAIAAISAVMSVSALDGYRNTDTVHVIESSDHQKTELIDEFAAKQALQRHGLSIPDGQRFETKNAVSLPKQGGKFAFKTLGLAHKTEQGAVHLDITSKADLATALAHSPDSSDGYLLEAMVEDVCCELLLGVTVDQTGLVSLTIGAGGVLTEILQDTITLLSPVSRSNIEAALGTLRVRKLLYGFRGASPVNIEPIIEAVLAVDRFVAANLDQIHELDINPLMVTASAAVAADALLVQQRKN